MYLIDLNTPKTKKKKRAARGRAGFRGKTTGGGDNGQKQRSKGKIRAAFEGGQTPIYRRLPKRQYMPPSNNRIEFAILNLSDFEKIKESSLGAVETEKAEKAEKAEKIEKIEKIEETKEITPELLLKLGVIRRLPKKARLKVLGNGTLSKKLTIKAHSFSKGARKKIEESGGTAELIQE